MALSIPDTFLSDTRPRAKEEQAPFRLSPHHTQALRDVAQGVEESDVGICCSYLVDSMSGEGADYVEHALNRLERFAEQALSWEPGSLGHHPLVRSWRARLQRCRRALRRLHERGDHETVAVLMIVYGHPDPIVRQIPELGAMGPLGGLARYTDAIETKRQERIALELETRFPHLTPLERLTRYPWVERGLGSGETLRAALAPFGEPPILPGQDEHPRVLEARREARRAREAAHREKRDAFVLTLRLESARMLARAEGCYHAAWLASAS